MHPEQVEQVKQLFTVNNIFYVCVRRGDNMSKVCDILGFSHSKLRRYWSAFFINGAPPSFGFLSNYANSNEIPLTKSARLFLFCNSHPDFHLNSQHLEYILFPKDKQFDHYALFNYFQNTPYFQQIKNNYSKIIKLLSPKCSKIFETDDRNITQEMANFRNCMRSITDLPECLKRLNNRQRYFVNMSLSLAYLGANVQIDRGGHSSSHLKGQFLAQVRKNSTGILSTGKNNVRKEDEDLFDEIKHWFCSNNHLYYKNLHQINLDEFISNNATSTVVCSIVDRRVPNDALANIILPEGLTAKQLRIDHKHEVMVRKRSNPKEIIWMSLESALPLMFPVLFPYGTIPIIPGSTLRKKSQNLLLSCDAVCNTGIGCQLILFLFDCITRSEYSFSMYQNQRINFPSDANRSFVPVPRANDPSFAVYWSEKEAEIQAMTYY